ncbi:LOB domain-containing protein 21 [Herrania umbratica]|uniref:LOB domain-containing protein 21 n=1 Tax=Herrania umbratica TaxID=108875 RepID=A0A6J1BD36_9ROSI|nr:LOB domain-containing protein 21 [Herrania umbratica]
MRSQEPRSSASCAACKLLKRRCTPNCIFAPYFRSDEPKKFAKVHKVFGASNVSKILIEVPEEQREETVNSLAYEAEARLRDPVYGCIGAIALLQRKMIELQHDLALARARLARYAATTSSAIISSDRVSMGPFGEFQVPAASCGGFIDSFSLNSYEVNQDAHMYDFSQIPYV